MLLFVAVLPVKQLNRTRVKVTQWHQQHLRNVCSRLKFLSKPLTSWKDYFFVSDKHRYFYCVTPKVAGTSWLLALIKLAGRSFSRVEDIHNRQIRDKILQLAENYTPGQIQTMLEKYYKFMFVREPLERLVSAYRYLCLDNRMCRRSILQNPSRSLKTGERLQSVMMPIDTVKCPSLKANLMN